MLYIATEVDRHVLNYLYDIWMIFEGVHRRPTGLVQYYNERGETLLMAMKKCVR